MESKQRLSFIRISQSHKFVLVCNIYMLATQQPEIVFLLNFLLPARYHNNYQFGQVLIRLKIFYCHLIPYFIWLNLLFFVVLVYLEWIRDKRWQNLSTHWWSYWYDKLRNHRSILQWNNEECIHNTFKISVETIFNRFFKICMHKQFYFDDQIPYFQSPQLFVLQVNWLIYQ